MTSATKTPGESPRVSVRIKPAGTGYIDGKAAEFGRNRSWAIKTMLAFATLNMRPSDWQAAAKKK